MTWLEAIVLGALLFLAVIGQGCAGWDVKDLTASISANVCAGVKLEADDGGIAVDWSIDACAKGTVLGLELPELCASASD
jgi:hypothetical protein